MIVKNAHKVWVVYCDYGSGWINWSTAIARLIALDVPQDKAAGVLIGQIMIAGHG